MGRVSYAPVFAGLPTPRVLRKLAVLPALCLLAACAGLPSGDLGPDTPASAGFAATDRPPLPRATGERLPPFSGGDPSARGWTKVDDLLWIESRDKDAYARGYVSDGASYVSVDAAPTRRVCAERGFRLRTDHLAVHTNAPWIRALEVAREAEAHVHRLVGAYGEALDLRLPEGPMKVVVTATRAEFEETLRCLVDDPVGWGAFYDARTGNVYVSLEPARQGPLPWRADLRHEMTHQILDLSRPVARRARPFAPPWFWLWEAFSVWTEGLGDEGAAQTLEPRLARFRRSYAFGTWTRLDALFALGPATFEGPHYDQTASLMRFLLDPKAWERRNAVLDVLRRLLQGPVPDTALEEALGMSTAEVERRWTATVGR